MENKEMVNLLEKSILPLMAEMIKAMGEHSHRYENHVKSINTKVGSVEGFIKEESGVQKHLLDGIREISKNTELLTNRDNNQEEILTILTKTITAFGERLTNLIDTNNKLIDHQQTQAERMDDVIFAFEENTARLNTLTLAIRDNERDILNKETFHTENPIYKEISERQEGSAEIIENKNKPIHKVLEDEIAKLKENK